LEKQRRLTAIDPHFRGRNSGRGPRFSRRKTHVDPAHGQPSTRSRRCPRDGEPVVIRRTGDQVARRSLDFYQAVGRRLTGQGRAQ
jgi:hypothetical protein